MDNVKDEFDKYLYDVNKKRGLNNVNKKTN